MGSEVPMSARVLVGRYRLGGLLGRGGMAEVYSGYDERLHRPVAVKLLRPEMAAAPDVLSRFEVEARAAACLSHPNVVGVFDTGEHDGTPFIVMERLPGETLADRMHDGPLEQSWVRRVAADVLAALSAAHAAAIVHRDVKPGNILIAEDGSAKVADFGIAKSAEMVGDITGTGLLVGTPAYLAPERLQGHPATERSDLYSLAVVLYEALAGVKPFEGATSVATASAVVNQHPRPLRELRPDVDPEMAGAIERAMAKDPSARPGSALEMAAAIASPAADATVSFEPESGDATLVGVPGMVNPPASGSPAATGPVPAGPSRRPAAWAGLEAAWRRGGNQRLFALVGAAALLLLIVLLVMASGGGSGDGSRKSLASDIRDLAGRVEEGDGAKGPEAAERLMAVADQVEAGGGSDDARALLVDSVQWRATGLLSEAAATEVASVLTRIEGVDPSLATTTMPPTTLPVTLPATTQPPPDSPGGDGDGDRDGDEGKGKGKGRGD